MYKKYKKKLYKNFYIFFLLFFSLEILVSSLPICPAIDVFSSALRTRYGITSFTGPYGTYFATLYPSFDKL